MEAFPFTGPSSPSRDTVGHPGISSLGTGRGSGARMFSVSLTNSPRRGTNSLLYQKGWEFEKHHQLLRARAQSPVFARFTSPWPLAQEQSFPHRRCTLATKPEVPWPRLSPAGLFGKWERGSPCHYPQTRGHTENMD